MNSKAFNLIIFLASVFISGAAFFMTGSFYFLGGTFLFFFLSFYFFLKPAIRKHLERERKRHETYKFINSFLINLSISNSIEKAFIAGSEGLGKEFNEIINQVKGTCRDKTYYLINYFESNEYQMFLNILSLYEVQGGDILNLSSNLMLEVARLEDSGNINAKNRAANLKEYITMWLLAFVIFLFMRFGLSSFYDTLKSNVVFLMGIGIFLGFLLVSILAYSLGYTSQSLRKAKVQVKENANE